MLSEVHGQMLYQYSRTILKLHPYAFKSLGRK